MDSEADGNISVPPSHSFFLSFLHTHNTDCITSMISHLFGNETTGYISPINPPFLAGGKTDIQ